MTDERDPVVARALAQIEVPDHGDEFWDRLDARLRSLDEPSVVQHRPDTAELPAVAALRPEPPAPRAARLRFLAAAAAVAVVALATGVVLRGGEDEGIEAAATTTAVPTTDAPATLSTPDEPSPTSATTATTVADPDPGVAAQGAALAWVDALGRGDTDAAAALVGPGTERYLASQGQTVEDFVTTASEGYGAWSASEDLTTTEVDIPGAGIVVVLTGTVEREGMVEQAVQPLPVVTVDGAWYVEPVAASPETGGRVEIVNPAPEPGYWTGQPADAVLEASSEDPNATFWFSLDDQPAVEDADGVWDPPGELPSGTHLLVVAAVGDDLFTAVAGTFVVEG